MTHSKPNSPPVSETPHHSIEHIDLALSGGGFRATLFHLGVIGFLQSQGLLHKVRTICSVSGGSILAAHMVTRWHEYEHDEEKYFVEAAEHLIKSIQRDDISWRALRRFRSVYRVLLRRALDSETLVDEYRRLLAPTPITRWDDLARLNHDIPDLQLLATHINTATMCGFNREEFFISPNRDNSDPLVKGLVQFAAGVKIDGEEIARAVAASSAFPPVFAPLPVVKGSRDNLFLLTDGGVYDNSGVRRLRELYEKNNWTSHRNRLGIVSDAGHALSVVVGQQFDSIIELGTRVSDAQANRIATFDTDQTEEFFKEHDIPLLRCSIHETLVGSSVPRNHSLPLQHKLRTIRTELDKFSDVEVFTLYRHGFLIAKNQYLAKLKGELTDAGEKGEFWLPYKDRLIDRTREELEHDLAGSHEMKKIAWLRRIAIPLAAGALGLVLLLGAFIGALLGWSLPPRIVVGRQLPPALDTGTGHLVNWIDRLELQLLDTDFVKVHGAYWPYAYGSGLAFHQMVDGNFEFYMITDRGPAFEGPKTADGKTFKLYLYPDYVPHIARVQWQKNQIPSVVESFELHYGRRPTEGLPPVEKADKELTVRYAENNSYAVLPSPVFGIDPEDLAVDAHGAFWISEEYRPAVMKAVQTPPGVIEIQPNVLSPGDGLPAEFKQARPNRGIESITIKGDWLFVALQGAFNKDPNVDGNILIARARVSELEQFVQNRTPPKWDIFKYAIRDFYKKPGSECSIGAIYAIDEKHLLVLEREVKFKSRQAMITMVSVPDDASSAPPLTPIPIVDLGRAGWISEKPEGITMIDDKTIVISSDNDFGMLLEGMIDLSVEHPAGQPAGDDQLPVTNMEFFQTVADSDGKYSLKCRIKGFENRPLTIKPQDRADERRPAFWVIHMKDSLLAASK